MDVAKLKRLAGEKAAEFVESGMIVGLGHGSTAIYALYYIAELLKKGKLRDITGIPCSRHVEKEAQKLDIPLFTFNDCVNKDLNIDLTIDGADEVDLSLNIIKGGGGALLREKIVAQVSRREIIVVDESKLSPVLGTHWAVPVEVISFGCNSQKNYLERLDADVKIRKKDNGDFFITDQGNILMDCNFGPIKDPYTLSEKLAKRVGIVEHGLFLDIATDVIVAGNQGVRHIVR
ncbi:ribose-5-phosphate isomerase RpiA [Candidatus Poribacteria bacterium]|nr:ribose-5-phosphate isomerase RpiA [Candidatus Poribacteria bacterium]